MEVLLLNEDGSLDHSLMKRNKVALPTNDADKSRSVDAGWSTAVASVPICNSHINPILNFISSKRVIVIPWW
jgi:hypothetical protein